MGSDDAGERPAKKAKFDPKKLLEKMGWEKGKGLGKDAQGVKTYITVQKKSNQYGVGADRSQVENMHKRALAAKMSDALASVAAAEKRLKRERKERRERRRRERELGAGAAAAAAAAPPPPPKPAKEESAAAKTEQAYAGCFVSGGVRGAGDGEEVTGKKRKRGAQSDAEDGSKERRKKDKKQKKKEKKKAKKEKKKSKKKRKSADSDDSSSSGPITAPTQMSDDALFKAMGGARFGKLGRHSNSSARWQRIQKAETDAAAHVSKARDRWKGRSPRASPKAAPRKSPRAPPKSPRATAKSPRSSPKAAPQRSPRAAPRR